MKPLVLLDCDGIISDFVSTSIRKCNATFGHDDVDKPDFLHRLGPHHKEVISSKGFVAEMNWYAGAKEFFRTMHEISDLRILTSPYKYSEYWHHERVSWLQKEIPEVRVIFASSQDKELVRGDFLVEDIVENAVSWSRANLQGTALLLDRPWNRDVDFGWDEFHRVYTYQDIIDNVHFFARTGRR